MSATTRRGFIASVLAGSGWTLGLAPAAAQAPASAPPPGFSPWLRLQLDGQVVAYTNISDIGQGTWTALRASVAEQLEVPLEQVQVQQAPLEAAYQSPWIKNYATFGSLGWRTGNATLAVAAAGAREMLVAAAAERWGAPAGECRARDGAVHHGGRSLPYAELLREAATRTPPARPAVKPRAMWRLLGQALPRPGAQERVSGALVYGIDVRRPGQLHAAVRHAPQFGGSLLAVEEAPALRVEGALKVVRLPGAVAVIARNRWAAQKAVQALAPRWGDGATAGLDSEALRRALHAAAQAGGGRPFAAEPYDPALSPERTAAALQSAAQVVDLSFEVPFLAHATMEPLNATVQVDAGRAELWLSTQSQLDTQRAVARALGLEPAQVAVHTLPAGGGFGRRLEHDFAVQAALIARAMPGRPVQTLWTREVDMRAGHYRPAAAARVQLALDADGAPLALRADVAQPSLLAHSGLTNGPPGGQDWTATMGWLRQPYAMPALQLSCTTVERGVPCGYWRSVGYSQNTFFYECTLDIAARRAGSDPLTFRRRLLAGKARELAFLDALVQAARWDEQPLPEGRGRGIAITSANGSISGHVVELAVTAPGRFRLLKITAAIDAGVVADPRAVQAQMMGGTVFGLSAALAGEITLAGGEVEQGNFDRYPLVRMAQLPPLDVRVLANGERSGGVGEEGPPTIGPAVANALFAATGMPVTRLPLTRAGWALEA